jgi:hypothetical protein
MSADAIGWIALLVMIAPGVIMGLKEALAAGLRRPRSLSWGRGRWRLVAWYHVRLSSGTQYLLAVGLVLALVVGGPHALDVLRRHLEFWHLVVLWAAMCGLGIFIALRGMRQAWRSGERHRWPERWSERPQDEITGLAPRRPDAPPVPSRPGATRGGRPR